MSDSVELAQLRELIEVFPDKYSIDQVEEANAVSRIQFEFLDNEIIPAINRLRLNGQEFDLAWYLNLTQVFHRFMFDGVVSINGMFRKIDQPNDGRVYFGGQDTREIKPMFTGSKPEEITIGLEEAFKFLIDEGNDEPLNNALRFYQRFVYVHPFYDGNGRVARLIVNLFLLQSGYYLDWRALQEKAKFLKKLNRYHKTKNEQDFEWWVNLCQKHLKEISDVDIESDPGT